MITITIFTVNTMVLIWAMVERQASVALVQLSLCNRELEFSKSQRNLFQSKPGLEKEVVPSRRRVKTVNAVMILSLKLNVLAKIGLRSFSQTVKFKSGIISNSTMLAEMISDI